MSTSVINVLGGGRHGGWDLEGEKVCGVSSKTARVYVRASPCPDASCGHTAVGMSGPIERRAIVERPGRCSQENLISTVDRMKCRRSPMAPRSVNRTAEAERRAAGGR